MLFVKCFWAVSFEKHQYIFMVNSKTLIPPYSRVAIAPVNNTFKKLPANIINPIYSQSKRSKGFGKIFCSIADNDDSNTAVFRHPEKMFT